MIMRCGRQGWSPRRPNLICHNPSVTAIVSRVRVLLAHQGMSLPDALAPADVRLPVWVKMRRTLIEQAYVGRSTPESRHCSARMARQKSAKGRHPACKGLSRYTSLHQESRVDASMRDPVPSLTARSI